MASSSTSTSNATTKTGTAATIGSTDPQNSSDLILKYVYNNQITPNAYKKADLFRLAIDKGRKNNGVLKLVVDVKSCWDRLVGCSKKDLVLTPWKSIHSNLQQLIHTSTTSNLDLVFFFDGTGSENPSKPPAFVVECILLILRSLGAQCRSTVDHHEIELIKFVAKFHLHGIITCDPGFVAWDNVLDTKIWCGMKFKSGGMQHGQQWRGSPSLESHELSTEIVLDHLKLEKPRFLLLLKLLHDPALGLGLIQHYSTSNGEPTNTKQISLPPSFIEAVKSLSSIDPNIVEHELNSVIQKPQLKIFEQLNKYRLREKKILHKTTRVAGVRPSTVPGKSAAPTAGPKSKSDGDPTGGSIASRLESLNIQTNAKPLVVTSILERRKEHTGESSPFEEEAASMSQSEHTPFTNLEREIDNILSDSPYGDPDPDDNEDTEQFADAEQDPEVHDTHPNIEPKSESSSQTQGPSTSSTTATLPTLLIPSKKVEQVAFARHTTGLMHPAINQLYKSNTIQLPCCGASPTDPNSVFSLLRSKMYAALFNSNHMKFLGRPITIKIKEISNGKESEAPGVEVGWQIPTVERLWLGDDCKPKRIRAFFSITCSERQSLLNPEIVPQRVLVFVVALRYILSRGPVLRRSELDAFLIQSILMNMDQEQRPGRHTGSAPPRTIYLIQLLSSALTHLLVLNDAVGAPIPFQLFIASQFFDGATFTRVLSQLVRQTPAELCGPSLVVQMERLRMAVLDGSRVKFIEGDDIDLQQRGRPLMQIQTQPHRTPLMSIPRPPPRGMGMVRPQIPVQSMYGGVPGVMFSNPPPRTPYFSTAGQLHVAGQVVGQWGPNKTVNGGIVPRQPQGPNYGRVSRNPVGILQSTSNHGSKKHNKQKRKQKKPSTSTSSETSGPGTAATNEGGHEAPAPVQIAIKSKPVTPPAVDPGVAREVTD